MKDNEMRSILKNINLKDRKVVASVDDIEVYRAFHPVELSMFGGEYTKVFDGDFLVILKNGERAGLIHTCGDEDIYWYMAKKFRGQHILSRVLRTNIIKKTWPYTKGITYIKPGKGGINHHLASEGGLIFRGPELAAFHMRGIWPYQERPDFLHMKKNSKKSDSMLINIYSHSLASFTEKMKKGDVPECSIPKEDLPKVLAWFSTNFSKPRSEMHRVTVGWASIICNVSTEVDVDISDADCMAIAKWLGYGYHKFGIVTDCDSPLFFKNVEFLSREEFEERTENNPRPMRAVVWNGGKYRIIRTGA